MIKLNITYSGSLYWKKEKCNNLIVKPQYLEHFDNRQWVLHNNNGPALLVYRGIDEWFQCGNRHRLDGPAIERIDGRNNWYIDDVFYHNEFEYWIAVQNYDKT